jgi:lysophospholipase L1-like esterase
MNKKFIYFVFSLLLVLSACSSNVEMDIIDPNVSNARNKILPLGASRVDGARPMFESYRYELWKRLIDGGYSFDYVGSNLDEAAYPNYAGQSFDRDHSGYGGLTSGQILSNLPAWLNASGTPDIVLLSSPGGNDALLNLPYNDAVSNINSIIDLLQERNPNVTIIIEQLAPGMTSIMTPTLTNYMQQMQQEVVNMAAAQSTTTSRVITVDMFTGFNDSLLADDVHYNEAGAQFIAQRYYAVLESVLE